MTHPPEPKEPEGLATGKVVAVGVVALAVFAAGILWAGQILGGREPLTKPVDEYGRADVGIVNQRPFGHDLRAEDLRASQRRRLSSYGWADPQERRIRVPIDKAIDAVAAEHAQEPAK